MTASFVEWAIVGMLIFRGDDDEVIKNSWISLTNTQQFNIELFFSIAVCLCYCFVDSSTHTSRLVNRSSIHIINTFSRSQVWFFFCLFLLFLSSRRRHFLFSHEFFMTFCRKNFVDDWIFWFVHWSDKFVRYFDDCNSVLQLWAPII